MVTFFTIRKVPSIKEISSTRSIKSMQQPLLHCPGLIRLHRMQRSPGASLMKLNYTITIEELLQQCLLDLLRICTNWKPQPPHLVHPQLIKAERRSRLIIPANRLEKSPRRGIVGKHFSFRKLNCCKSIPTQMQLMLERFATGNWQEFSSRIQEFPPLPGLRTLRNRAEPRQWQSKRLREHLLAERERTKERERERSMRENIKSIR